MKETVQRNTTHGTYGKSLQTYTLDWDEVTADEMRALATKSVVIDIQRLARAAESKVGFDGFSGQEYKVKDLISGQRKGKSNMQKADIALSKLTDEELRAKLAELQAKLEPKGKK